MSGRIAWVRLTLYIGSSLLLIAEGYRFSLVYLGFIIQSTGLMPIFELFVSWALFLGYVVLTTSFYTLEKRTPPLLDLNNFDYQKLHRANFFGIFQSILLLIFIITPPAGTGEGSAAISLQIFLNILWISFYVSLFVWLIYIKAFTRSETIKEVLNEKKFLIHLVLVVLLIFEWAGYTYGIIILPTSVFVNSLFIPILSATLVFFLLFQIYYFYNLSRFSYLIIG